MSTYYYSCIVKYFTNTEVLSHDHNSSALVKEYLLYRIPKQLNTRSQSLDPNHIEYLW